MSESDPHSIGSDMIRSVFTTPSGNTGVVHMEHFPKSPTDDIMSPVTRKLFAGRKHMNPIDQTALSSYRVDHHVFPSPSPCPDEMPLVFGSSSANRKEVIDCLGWKYIQMSPDIDGTLVICSLPLLYRLSLSIYH